MQSNAGEIDRRAREKSKKHRWDVDTSLCNSSCAGKWSFRHHKCCDNDCIHDGEVYVFPSRKNGQPFLMPVYHSANGLMHALDQKGRIIISKDIHERLNGGMTGFLRRATSLEGCAFPEQEVKIVRSGWRGLLISMVSFTCISFPIFCCLLFFTTCLRLITLTLNCRSIGAWLTKQKSGNVWICEELSDFQMYPIQEPLKI